MSRRRRRPNAASLLAWLGVLGTILGILGFFVTDLPGLLGNDETAPSDPSIVNTLVALEREKLQAEFQLTQIALENQQAANQGTQQAVATQGAIVQSTLDAAEAEQANLVATSNAAAALTATMDAANAQATVEAQNATATANFLAELEPTPTPPPTITPPPAVAADHRSIEVADVRQIDGNVVFAMRVSQPIPETPQQGLSYVWALDTDRSAETGLGLEDIGIDAQVTVAFGDGAWVGTVGIVQPDGTPGESFLFFDVELNGANLLATLDAAEFGLPATFDWAARVEQGGETYSPFPASGHASFDG